MIILAIDPGTSRANPAGLVVIDTDKMALLYSECIAGHCWQDTAQAVFLRAVSLGVVYSFQGVAWEDSYFDRKKDNPQTYKTLATFSGIGLAIAAWCVAPYAAVAPNEAKLALTRDGHADKDGMVKMAKLVFRLPVDPSPHIADACGVGLAGATKLASERLVREAIL